MRGVSQDFLSSLRGGHVAIFRARVCDTFQTGVDPDGVEIPILGGDVISSARTDVRASLNLSTTGDWPRRADSLLAPYGNEIYIERGLSYGNGRTEYVGLGYFRIDTPEQDVVPDGIIEISGQDRWAGIVDARFLYPRQFASNVSRGAVVQLLIREVYPDALVEWDDTGVRDATLGRTIMAERDRAGTITALLTSLGKVGYFDHRGIYAIKTPPSVTGAPSWTVDAGNNGVLVEMSRAITREGIYNVVVANGEATDTAPPAVAAVADLNPNSPTRYGGRFGPVPRFYSSPFITTTAQARSAAEGLLRKSIGMPYQVDLKAVPNPALEPYDVVKVRYPAAARSRSLNSEKHVLDTVTIPLSAPGVVMLKTRQQFGELIGDVTA